MSRSTSLPNLHHVRGDLLAHDADYIVHQCNCRTTRAWGLAYSLFGSFPHADTYTVPSDPKLAPMPPKRVPGTLTLHGGPGTGLRGVINLYGQDAPGKASVAAETKAQRLTWFTNALLQLADVPNLKSVAFPHGIGCGLAGGSWAQYEAALVAFAALVPKTEVYIVQMPTTAPKGKLKRSKAVARGKLKRAVKKVVAKEVTTPSNTTASSKTKRTTATPSGKLKQSKAVGRGEPTSAPTPTTSKETTNKHSPRDGA